MKQKKGVLMSAVEIFNSLINSATPDGAHLALADPKDMPANKTTGEDPAVPQHIEYIKGDLGLLAQSLNKLAEKLMPIVKPITNNSAQPQAVTPKIQCPLVKELANIDVVVLALLRATEQLTYRIEL